VDDAPPPGDARRIAFAQRARLARLGLTLVEFARLCGATERTARRAVQRNGFLGSALGRLLLAMERDPSLIDALRSGRQADPSAPWDGLPPNPDRDGEHMLARSSPYGPVMLTGRWSAEFQTWHLTVIVSPADLAARGVAYCGPIGADRAPSRADAINSWRGSVMDAVRSDSNGSRQEAA
jgi:hypothetical protein